MLRIRRSCSYKIINRALQYHNRPLVALLSPGGADCEPCIDFDQLQANIDASHEAIIVYNQHAEAIALVDGLVLSPGRVLIEIRQDTKGVLGLHATRRQRGEIETLELIYQ